MNMAIDLQKYSRIMDETFFKRKGRVENVVGLTIERSWVICAESIRHRRSINRSWRKW